MGIKAVVSSVPKTRVSIDKQESTVVRTVGVDAQIVNQIKSLTDVLITNPQNGEPLVFDADSNKFINGSLNQLDGGEF